MVHNYNGYGAAGTQHDGTDSGNKVFFIYPQTSTSPSQTYANLAVSTRTWPNFDMSMDVKKLKQLRQNALHNTWETA